MGLNFEQRRRRRIWVARLALGLSMLAFAVTLVGLFGGDSVAQSNVRPPEGAQVSPTDGAVPGGVSGVRSDADLWRYVRGQETPGWDATVSIPNRQAAVLVQSGGEEWRAIRNGPLPLYGLYALGGMAGLLVLFFLARGRIRIDHGLAGVTILRFNALERFGHWLLAVSFIVLAVSGLNLLYGRYVLPDLIGAEAFAAVSQAGKWAHNNLAWAFMLGLVLVFFMWVLHNLPSWTDVKWLAKGGGLFVKGVHPDSRKFNAGQKMIFWSTIILGGSLSASGVALLFPFETAMMGKTFALLNTIGFNLDASVTPMEEMQYQSLWHAIVGLAMIAIIVAHIYIGSIGMEGAFDAMGSGHVDLNWAREHHNLWVAEVEAKDAGARGGAATPAE